MTLIAGARAAVELHTNASANPSATGVEVVSAPAQKPLAQHLAIEIANVLGLHVRGENGWIDESRTAVGASGRRLGFIARGGMIVETFFLTNANDLRAYLARRQDVARAIARVLESA
jgi:N-acetylmuramoyl-L-alanine amidase